VGEAVAESGLPRADVFVTSKLSNAFHTRDSALHAFDASLTALDFDYVDLFLIHWPLPRIGDFVEAWKALEEVYASGRAKAIGVSNFNPQHLQRIFDEAEVVPAVNQIEVHPYLAQTDLRAFNAAHGIATEAWSPIAQGKVLSDPMLESIADRHGKTPAQIALRWHIQLGNIVFPKTVTPARLAENFDLFDFELDTEEVATITALDRKERTGADPEEFHYIPQ
jgi:2,5-diketo-D-gluconate reductase A